MVRCENRYVYFLKKGRNEEHLSKIIFELKEMQLKCLFFSILSSGSHCVTNIF